MGAGMRDGVRVMVPSVVNIDTAQCIGCIRYRDLIRMIPGEPSEKMERVWGMFHYSHHKILHYGTRMEDFRGKLEKEFDAVTARMYGELAIEILVRSIHRAYARGKMAEEVQPQAEGDQGDGGTRRVFATPREVREARTATLTQHLCVCGCGETVIKPSAMFRAGHDKKVMSMFWRLERGLMTWDQMPESLKAVSGVLPKCVCCGNPIFRGTETASGWMGQICAMGTCGCREREKVKTEQGERLQNRKIGRWKHVSSA